MRFADVARRVAGVACVLAVWSLVSGAPATACDTPVYRYAMYRWDPAPYEVYYFHQEAISEDAARLHKILEDASMSEEKPANVMFVPVNLTEDKELKRIPPDVRQSWQEQEEPTVPTYMVVTPYGQKIFQGNLDEAALQSLMVSDARDEVAKQLAEGKATVLLMVTGSDKAQNTEAEKVCKELVKDIAEGKIEFYLPPTMYDPTGEAEESSPGIEIGFHRVERDDPKEKWLVDSLMSMESDLRDEEFAPTPMIFGVFGRGRALPPFIGKGINRDNLLDCVDFVTGACSCTVKDQNPGMDLLFTYDWYTAAENLANAFGAEEGNETQFGAEDFFPNLMIPPTDTATDDASTEEPEEAATVEGEAAEGEATEGDPADSPETGSGTLVSTTQVSEASDSPAGDTQTEGAPAEQTPAESTSAAADTEEDGEETQGEGETEVATAEPIASGSTGAVEASPFFGVFAVGAGVGVALLLLFGLTFVVLRPR